MKTYTTYIASPAMSYGMPGYDDALAASIEVNKILRDSEESSFITGDSLAESTTKRAMQRELDSCRADVRGNLVVDVVISEIGE